MNAKIATSIDDDEMMKCFSHYSALIADAEKFEFEFEGIKLQISPEVCLDSALKWHIRAWKEGEWRLIGACANLWDIQVIITRSYIKEITLHNFLKGSK